MKSATSAAFTRKDSFLRKQSLHFPELESLIVGNRYFTHRK